MQSVLKSETSFKGEFLCHSGVRSMEESVESMIKNLANNSVFIGRCFQESGPCTCPSRCMHAPCSSTLQQQQQLSHSRASEGFARCALNCGRSSWRIQAG